jgi:indole-3-glycerol phosphate synthase
MSENLLETLTAEARQRVTSAAEITPLSRVKSSALSLPIGDFPFEAALRKPGLSFICEVKRASPSKGLIVEDFRPTELAVSYEAAGADAVSVLTEPKRFLGSDEYLKKITETIRLPALRKDFTVSEYQIYEAKLLGAAAVLLICSILPAAELQSAIALAHSLGLSALVETRNETELRAALDGGARIVGINSRDLRSFEVDFEVFSRLRPLIPKGILFVAESGIKSPDDAAALKAVSPDAVLIGEAMSRAADKSAFLASLREAAAF